MAWMSPWIQVNGDANAAIAQEAAAAGVPRMAYISAHDFNFPGVWSSPGMWSTEKRVVSCIAHMSLCDPCPLLTSVTC